MIFLTFCGHGRLPEQIIQFKKKTACQTKALNKKVGSKYTNSYMSKFQTLTATQEMTNEKHDSFSLKKEGTSFDKMDVKEQVLDFVD